LKAATTWNRSKTIRAWGSFFNGLDVGVPHVHGNGLNGLALPRAEPVKKAHQGLGFPIFAHVENATGFVVEYHGQVAVALADGDLVDRQDVKARKVGGPVSGL